MCTIYMFIIYRTVHRIHWACTGRYSIGIDCTDTSFQWVQHKSYKLCKTTLFSPTFSIHTPILCNILKMVFKNFPEFDSHLDVITLMMQKKFSRKAIDLWTISSILIEYFMLYWIGFQLDWKANIQLQIYRCI